MTRADREHLSRVAELGCIVCRNLGIGYSPAVVHHIRDGYGVGQRAPHTETIPLCPAHHDQHGYGVSFHSGPALWQEKFGTERGLLEQVRGLLGIETSEVAAR